MACVLTGGAWLAGGGGGGGGSQGGVGVCSYSLALEELGPGLWGTAVRAGAERECPLSDEADMERARRAAEPSVGCPGDKMGLRLECCCQRWALALGCGSCL